MVIEMQLKKEITMLLEDKKIYFMELVIKSLGQIIESKENQMGLTKVQEISLLDKAILLIKAMIMQSKERRIILKEVVTM